jgi:hypothetical protein
LPKIVAALRRSPGFIGFENLRPVKACRPKHVSILRFDSEANLHRWEASPERKRGLAEATEFTEHVLPGHDAATVPAGGTGKDARWIDVHQDDLDEAQMANWIRQAAAMPGWGKARHEA